MPSEEGSVVRWLVCGASAGLAVDIGLYPLDTIKSRMQSKQGFIAAGGFKDIYRCVKSFQITNFRLLSFRGMSSVLVGSAPGAAIFFLTYKYINGQMKRSIEGKDALVDAFSASLAEIAACAVRVPTELCKQRGQVNKNTRLTLICKEIMESKGLKGFYQGYGSTVAREIPFSIIQFPIWEGLKRMVAERNPLEGAACGSVAGCIAAGLTTPLDVAKTRIMLTKTGPTLGILSTLKEVIIFVPLPSNPSLFQVYTSGGIKGLYSGVVPRVMWISGGGFVFFGAYETAMHFTKFLD
ncbi:hypothetical protein CRE_04436 [Caenorhabditis remanei]|uniref:S-adenosylmethionine mitochondrial carrier protein n=1 Tax=Caenorhabditis remanei TaxID=31234 RepID=E3NQZ3_CAERE|nr:hypothetical protein CRE_04436 [Caenorhabditis remanei]